MTVEEILKSAENIYFVTGIKLVEVSELNDSNTVEEFNIAWVKDRNYLRGVADTIYDLT